MVLVLAAAEALFCFYSSVKHHSNQKMNRTGPLLSVLCLPTTVCRPGRKSWPLPRRIPGTLLRCLCSLYGGDPGRLGGVIAVLTEPPPALRVEGAGVSDQDAEGRELGSLEGSRRYFLTAA